MLRAVLLAYNGNAILISPSVPLNEVLVYCYHDQLDQYKPIDFVHIGELKCDQKPRKNSIWWRLH